MIFRLFSWKYDITNFFFLYSGAEDFHAYLWDRFYGMCLAKYQHTDVVNSVAFNSRDSEMLVTTSDDFSIKVFVNPFFSDKLLIKLIFFLDLAVIR